MLGQVVGAPAGAKSATVHLWQWIDLGKGSLSVGVDLTLDPLSAVMIMVITGVGFLIHVYSVGYMAEDRGIARFFSYMNLFIFSMLVLVLAADLLILIIGWALVALSSYLLIGFWYERPSAVLAARKAFITQVIGDVALVIAAFLIVLKVGTLQHSRHLRVGRLVPGQWAAHHRDLLAAGHRGLRQERPVPAAHVAARRHGGSHPGVGAHPRRHHGDRGGVPDRAFPPALRPRPGGPGNGGVRRHRHRGDGRRDRAQPGRHQAGDRVLDDVADRADDLRRRHRRVLGGDVPLRCARGVQGAALHGRRQRHPRAPRRAGHPPHGRGGRQDEAHRTLLPERDVRAGGDPVLRRLLQQGGPARFRADQRPGCGALGALPRRARHQRAHRPVRVPALGHRLPRRTADGAGVRRPRGAAGDAPARTDPRGAQRRPRSGARCVGAADP